MRHWLAIACLVALLFGCNTVRPEPLPPYVLSDAETTIVLRGIYSAVKDLDDPSLRSLKATRRNSGEVYVCGWVSFRTSKGYRTEKAFIGTLSAGRFSTDRVGKNNYPHREGLAASEKSKITISQA